MSKSELQEMIDLLESIKGRQTELISVYIPAGYDINSVQRQLEAEKGTAKNIKSTATRKNVGEALDKIVRYLKEFKKTPDNGMAVFAGNVSQIEGQDDMQIWGIEPPEEMKTRLYRCDKEFVLEPLKDMLEVKEIFGLLVMDRKEATVGMLVGKRVEVLQHMTSGIPSKVRAGGQSSQRFHRITEGLTKDFYKRIAEEMKKSFFEDERLKGILIGGPIPTKDEFMDGDYLATKLKEKVIGVKDIGDADESGLKELVEKSEDILANQESVRQRQLLQSFFERLGEKPDLVTYREDKVRKALQYGAVDTLILSADLDRNLVKELKKLGEDISATVEIVSTDTTEGEQFHNLSGIGALLRFKV